MQKPEEFFVHPTPWVPNSRYPILLYRGACAHCKNDDEIKEFLESNGGWTKMGTFNSFFKEHYHPNVHECYGVASGYSELSLGRGPLDDVTDGVLVSVKRGDVVVLPAGVSHCSSTASEDYRYVVFFPKHEPPFISKWCNSEDVTVEDEKHIKTLSIPKTDPVQGAGGFLVKRWLEVDA